MHSQPPESRARSKGLSPRAIAFIYAAIAAGYLFTSIVLADLVVADPARMVTVQLLSGAAYIGLSAWLLHALIFHSIRKARAAEKAFAESDERYRRMIETTNEGVWVVDERGDTEYVNQTMADMLGYTVQEMRGRNRADFLDEHWQEVAQQTWSRRNRRIAIRHDFRFRREDGSPLWANVSSTPIIETDGRLQGSLMMITDISEHKLGQQALEANLQSQRALLNELDHRVRNMLSSILALVEISRSTSPDVTSFAQSIGGRIQALAKAHSLMARAARGQLLLLQVIEELLPPYQRSRFVLCGPPVSVAPAQVGSLALIVHELIAQSLESGALAHEQGMIEIDWTARPDRQGAVGVRMNWRERDGSGSRLTASAYSASPLISGLVRSDLRGLIETHGDEEGFEHEIRLLINSPHAPELQVDAPK